MRPPQRSRASTIVTPLPARASSRAVIRPAAPAPTIRKFVKGGGANGASESTPPKPTPIRHAPPSLQGVEPHRAAGQYLVPRLGGQRPDPLADHVRRAREEAVLMRIIGRPHDLVRADIVGQHGNAVLYRLERDPAIAPEQFARPHLRGGIVKPLVVEMPVHTVEPRRDPAAARFEERDAQSRVALDDAAPDHGP